MSSVRAAIIRKDVPEFPENADGDVWYELVRSKCALKKTHRFYHSEDVLVADRDSSFAVFHVERHKRLMYVLDGAVRGRKGLITEAYKHAVLAGQRHVRISVSSGESLSLTWYWRQATGWELRWIDAILIPEEAYEIQSRVG